MFEIIAPEEKRGPTDIERIRERVAPGQRQGLGEGRFLFYVVEGFFFGDEPDGLDARERLDGLLDGGPVGMVGEEDDPCDVGSLRGDMPPKGVPLVQQKAGDEGKEDADQDNGAVGPRPGSPFRPESCEKCGHGFLREKNPSPGRWKAGLSVVSSLRFSPAAGRHNFFILAK